MKGINSREFSAIDSALRDVIEQVESLRTAAEDYKEARSEKWAESDAGEAYENKIERIGDVIDSLTEAADELNDIVEEE